MARRNDRGMVLVLKGGRPEIDESDFGVEEHFTLCSLAVDCSRGRRYLAAVGESLIRAIAQKDVFWLQIGVNEVEIM